MMAMKKKTHLQALGRHVAALRQAKGLTQEKLAESSGLDPSYISGIERGVRNPSYLSLVKLASGLASHLSTIFQENTDSLHQRAKDK
jgi:transcriptional regulator with XRE-family HTH domain